MQKTGVDADCHLALPCRSRRTSAWRVSWLATAADWGCAFGFLSMISQHVVCFPSCRDTSCRRCLMCPRAEALCVRAHTFLALGQDIHWDSLLESSFPNLCCRCRAQRCRRAARPGQRGRRCTLISLSAPCSVATRRRPPLLQQMRPTRRWVSLWCRMIRCQSVLQLSRYAGSACLDDDHVHFADL